MVFLHGRQVVSETYHADNTDVDGLVGPVGLTSRYYTRVK